MYEYFQFSPYVTCCFWVCELGNGGRVAFGLQASSPFGEYRKKYTRQWHARGNATPSAARLALQARRLSSVERARAGKRENEKWELEAELRMKLIMGPRFRGSVYSANEKKERIVGFLPLTYGLSSARVLVWWWLHSFLFIRMLFSWPRLNVLIFLPILGWKYPCIILRL